MTEPNPFANLKLDSWFKVLIPFGGIMAIMSLVYSPSFIPQKVLFVLGCGIFLLGLGEWKNQKYMHQFVEASAFNPFMKITQPIRRNDPLGVFLDIIGIIAIIVSLADFFHAVNWLG
ncbi:MAG: hypothetical protein WBV92_03750 [Nitrosotalea sp.]